MSEVKDDEAKRSFASWKFGLIDAITCDAQKDSDGKELLGPQVKCVAIRILQHVDHLTMKAFPSIARLAAQLDVSEDRVKDAIKRLRKAGWISISRDSRTGSNNYQFVDSRVDDVLDARMDREERSREAKEAERVRRLARSGACEVAISPLREVVLSHPRGGDFTPCEVVKATPYHLQPNSLCLTPKDSAHEGEGLNRGLEPEKASLPPKSPNKGVENKIWTPAENFGEWLDGAPLPVGAYLPTFGRPTSAPKRNEYAAARDVDEFNTPFPVPSDGDEAERMISDMCQGTEINPTVKRHMMSMLQSGILTPRMFNGMMNPTEEGVA